MPSSNVVNVPLKGVRVPVRRLSIARHGDADPFGQITTTGRAQARLLGERLAHLRIDAVWHSPLPRAEASARILAEQLDGRVPTAAADELIDHVPHVPPLHELPAAYVPFFDGYDAAQAETGRRIARSLIARFATAPPGEHDVHEVLLTHAYPIAWLVRDALRAPEAAWLGLESANTALTVIDHRPGLPPSLVMFNDMTHLPPVLRWSGFPESGYP
jgi:probable phosphoglycerate mutase